MHVSFETKENFSTFLAARLIFATVLLGIGALFRTGSESALPYWTLFIANTSLSLGCWTWFHKRSPGKVVRWFALTGAVVLDTLILRYTGGARSEFVFLYFFSIGSAGLLTGLPGSLWTATLSSAGIAWLYYQSPSHFMAEHSLRVVVYAVNFLLTAALSSYVFERLRERERAHQRTLGELERTRLDTQAILDSLSTGVVVLDTLQRVLYLNPASRSVLNLDSGANVSDLERLFSVETDTGKSYAKCVADLTRRTHAEDELVLPPNHRPVGMSVSPLFEEDHSVRGHIVLLSDLSAAKESERLERERDRLAAIGQLSQDLAHEIRNPLATVRGCVEVIQMSGHDGDETRPYLELALRESDRLNGLLRDFLSFAHLKAPRKQRGSLRDFVSARARGAKLPIAIKDALTDELDAEFDADQFALVIEAILLTLAEWAEGKGEILIERGAASSNGIRFILNNTCIPAEIKGAAFRPFSDAHRLLNGLALPTALRVVHAHGGKLTLDCEPGVGTWFELAI